MITVERTADGVRLCRNQEEFVVTRDEIPRLVQALDVAQRPSMMAHSMRLSRNQAEFAVAQDEIPSLLRALRTVELAGVLEDWDAMVTAMGHPDARQEAL